MSTRTRRRPEKKPDHLSVTPFRSRYLLHDTDYRGFQFRYHDNMFRLQRLPPRKGFYHCLIKMRPDKNFRLACQNLIMSFFTQCLSEWCKFFGVHQYIEERLTAVVKLVHDDVLAPFLLDIFFFSAFATQEFFPVRRQRCSPADVVATRSAIPPFVIFVGKSQCIISSSATAEANAVIYRLQRQAC